LPFKLHGHKAKTLSKQGVSSDTPFANQIAQLGQQSPSQTTHQLSQGSAKSQSIHCGRESQFAAATEQNWRPSAFKHHCKLSKPLPLQISQKQIRLTRFEYLRQACNWQLQTHTLRCFKQALQLNISKRHVRAHHHHAWQQNSELIATTHPRQTLCA
tara:strand:- start:353 stop:823 length:471 start_codon:yes stop_codon:yes gene_type:complete